MSYRRPVSRPPRLSLLLAVFGSVLSFAGFGCVVLALYVVEQLRSVTASEGAVRLSHLLIEPLQLLFQGGFVTLAGGFLCMVIGGVAMIAFS
ncbi:MAG: hypothetical protein ABEH35_00805 [Haloarculaceae archaeon]